MVEIECEKCGSPSRKQVCAPGYVHGGFYDSVDDRSRVKQVAENWEKKTGQTLGGGD